VSASHEGLLHGVMEISSAIHLLLAAEVCSLLYSMSTTMPPSQYRSLHPEDGSSKVLQNIGIILQHYTVSQCRRCESSLSCKPPILHAISIVEKPRIATLPVKEMVGHIPFASFLNMK